VPPFYLKNKKLIFNKDGTLRNVPKELDVFEEKNKLARLVAESLEE
jgi:hypothetical protein